MQPAVLHLMAISATGMLSVNVTLDEPPGHPPLLLRAKKIRRPEDPKPPAPE